MISSGESMIDVATELKKRKANRIFVVSTFGLFTNGLERFDKAVEDGTIYKVVTTNLTYQTPELLSRPYYINCDMSKYIAYIIDTLNHDSSISDLLNPYDRIQKLVSKYKKNINNIVSRGTVPYSFSETHQKRNCKMQFLFCVYNHSVIF